MASKWAEERWEQWCRAARAHGLPTVPRCNQVLSRKLPPRRRRLEGWTEKGNILMDFSGMTPREAAQQILDYQWKHHNATDEDLVNQITTACQHFSNEALERARRWNHQAAVKDFMVKFGQYRQDKPGWPPQEVLDMRIRLIAEEFTELVESAGYVYRLIIERFDGEEPDGTEIHTEIFDEMNVDGDPDFEAFVDAHADLEYVLSGTLEACGVDGQQVWDEVHAANMRKEGGATRKDGKICKPAGWVGPDIERVLREQGWEG